MSYADDHAPKAIIVDGVITNHAELKRYWDRYNFQQYRLRRGMFMDLRRDEPEPIAPREVVHRYVYEYETKRDVRKQITPTRPKGMTIE